MAGIDYTLGLKTSGFDAGIKGAVAKVGSIATAAAKVTAAAAAVSIGGIAAILAKSVSAAARQETLETAFIPLLGSVDAARARIAELSAFAASTPFELPEIAEAGKVLETLTRGALSTGKGLTLVGDLAAGTGKPFNELASTVGRLYDGLQSGRPVGEVLMRLQEVGAVTGAARAQIEALAASGAGAEAWKAAESALGRFSGSMKLQSGTWNGLVSTLKDTWNLLLVTIGQPVMDSLKPFLEGAIARLESFKDTALKIGQAIGEQIGTLKAAFDNKQLFAVLSSGLKLAFLEAVNALGKGLFAVMAGAKAALAATGLLGALESVFQGLGELITASIMDGLAKVRFSGVKQEDADDFRMQSGANFRFAKQEFAALGSDLPEAAKAFAAASTDVFKNAAEIESLTAARQQYADLTAPLKEQARAESAERERKLRETAANIASNKPAVTQPAPVPAAAVPQPAVASTTPGPNWLERLGFLTGAGAKDTTAERTLQVAEKQTTLLAKIAEGFLNRPTVSATF